MALIDRVIFVMGNKANEVANHLNLDLNDTELINELSAFIDNLELHKKSVKEIVEIIANDYNQELKNDTELIENSVEEMIREADDLLQNIHSPESIQQQEIKPNNYLEAQYISNRNSYQPNGMNNQDFYNFLVRLRLDGKLNYYEFATDDEWQNIVMNADIISPEKKLHLIAIPPSMESQISYKFRKIYTTKIFTKSIIFLFLLSLLIIAFNFFTDIKSVNNNHKRYNINNVSH